MSKKLLNLSKENPQNVANEIFQFNIKIRKLESALEGYLGNGRNVSNEILTKYLTEFKNYSKLRISDVGKLRRRLVEIKSKVDSLRRSIERIEVNDEVDVGGVKIEMENIESLISELKHEQKDNYELLLRSEVSLWQECIFMERKIDSWESGEHEICVDKTIKPSKISEIISTRSGDSEPVMAFEKFIVENGGKTGGWTEIDHQTYLRIRQRYVTTASSTVCELREESAFIRELTSLLAPKTMKDIEQHEEWYRNYHRLLTEKKRFIDRWRQEKEKEKEREMMTVVLETESDGRKAASGPVDWEREKSRLEEQRRQLDEWRAAKAVEEQRMKKEVAEKEKNDRERRRREEERQRTELRKQVETYKQKKMEEEADNYELELKLKEDEEWIKRRDIEQHSARISERNTRMVEARLLRRGQRQVEEAQKEERLRQLRSKVAVTAPRDPSRLLRPTSGWRQRSMAVLEGEGEAGPCISSRTMIINNVQHRAVPSWRRGTP